MKVMCYALFACAFNLLIGFTGLLSFGHAAFLGGAAYAAGHALKVWGLPTELGLLVGLVAGAVLGLVMGMLAIRRSGIYFSMITLALAQMLYFFFLQAGFTGGEDGLQSVPRGTLLGAVSLESDITLYYVVLGIFVLSFLLIFRTVHSPFGQVLKAIRENEARATSLGYDTARFKLLAFVLSLLHGLMATCFVVSMMRRDARSDRMGGKCTTSVRYPKLPHSTMYGIVTLLGSVLILFPLAGIIRRTEIAYTLVLTTVILAGIMIARSRTMKAVVGGSIQRIATTDATVTAAHASTASTSARHSRPNGRLRRFAIGRCQDGDAAGVGSDRSGGRRDSPRALHLDRRDGHVLVTRLVAGLDRGNLVHDVHALGHAPEHRVARAAAARVEERVIDEVDEKLRRRAVRVVGAGHRQRAAPVLEPVVRLVADRRTRGLLLHVGRQAAALDHEARDHPVEDRAVEMAGVHVVEEIAGGDRRFLVEQFDREAAERGFESDHGEGPWGDWLGGEIVNGRGRDVTSPPGG